MLFSDAPFAPGAPKKLRVGVRTPPHPFPFIRRRRFWVEFRLAVGGGGVPPASSQKVGAPWTGQGTICPPHPRTCVTPCAHHKGFPREALWAGVPLPKPAGAAHPLSGLQGLNGGLWCQASSSEVGDRSLCLAKENGGLRWPAPKGCPVGRSPPPPLWETVLPGKLSTPFSLTCHYRDLSTLLDSLT